MKKQTPKVKRLTEAKAKHLKTVKRRQLSEIKKSIRKYKRLNESAAESLELKSLAKKLYLGFKKMGANVELATQKVQLGTAPGGNLDSKNVWISINPDSSSKGSYVIEMHLVGEKAAGFFDKIQKDFPQFEFKDRGNSKSWNNQNIKNLAIYPGATTSESFHPLNEIKKSLKKYLNENEGRELRVVDTDNRDSTYTILRLSNGDYVEVNVLELYQNLLDNQDEDE
jgi:hypothetical protein